jgi:hypothetical protein
MVMMNRREQTCMPYEGLEPTVSVFKPSKSTPQTAMPLGPSHVREERISVQGFGGKDRRNKTAK